MTKSPSEIIALVQQIIADYSPEDCAHNMCHKLQEDVAQLLQLPETTLAEKLAIAELLPSSLISESAIISFMETDLNKDFGFVRLIRKIVSSPCASTEAGINRRRWLRMFFDKFAKPLATSDHVALASAYVRSYDHQHEATEEEVGVLASVYLVVLQDALENYANEKYVFDIDVIEYLLSSPASDILLAQQDTDIAYLLKLLRKSIVDIDQSSNCALPQQYSALQNAIETLTRDLKLYRFIRSSEATRICFRTVHRILIGDESQTAEAAFDVFHDHKVVRHSIFVDKICKLDEVSKCIVLNARGAPSASKLHSNDVAASLSKLKGLAESVASQ